MKNFNIFTLGCQMNLSDSKRIGELLKKQGFRPSSEKKADIIIVNACSVRQKAVDRIWGGIKKWQNQNKKIIVAGCVLKSDKEKLTRRGIPVADAKTLVDIRSILKKPSDILQNIGLSDEDYFKVKPDNRASEHLVPIMTGCDNFCSYCAVPYTRGREKSRPVKDIIREVERAVRLGANKILLLGQNVNSYQFGFADLLEKIDNVPGNFEFNFMSSNPHDMTDEIINTFAGLKKWPRELHLPLQSGDDEILKKMNRKYTSKKYLELISKLKKVIPDIKLSTDVIVGFPSESKNQFNKTIKICKKVGFHKAYIAQYSPRPGTAAAKIADDVPEAEKKRRWEILEKLIN